MKCTRGWEYASPFFICIWLHSTLKLILIHLLTNIIVANEFGKSAKMSTLKTDENTKITTRNLKVCDSVDTDTEANRNGT